MHAAASGMHAYHCIVAIGHAPIPCHTQMRDSKRGVIIIEKQHMLHSCLEIETCILRITATVRTLEACMHIDVGICRFTQPGDDTRTRQGQQLRSLLVS